MAQAWNGCSQSSRFPIAGQGDDQEFGNEIDREAKYLWLLLISPGPIYSKVESSRKFHESEKIIHLL